jgi:GNAT superfamily N-acetyltransferase
MTAISDSATAIDTGTPPTTIRKAREADRSAVAATVAAGFFDDPVTCWLLPDIEVRRAIIEPMFALLAGAYLPRGETYLSADGNGVAVWLPPGTELLTETQAEAFGVALEDIAGPALPRLAMLEETFGQHHPETPLYYLQFLATVPAFQGQGIGARFLRSMLERADREGMPAYHEATTPRNRALYERHGYENLGEFRLPDGGPPLWRMWREPR